MALRVVAEALRHFLVQVLPGITSMTPTPSKPAPTVGHPALLLRSVQLMASTSSALLTVQVSIRRISRRTIWRTQERALRQGVILSTFRQEHRRSLWSWRMCRRYLPATALTRLPCLVAALVARVRSCRFLLLTAHH